MPAIIPILFMGGLILMALLSGKAAATAKPPPALPPGPPVPGPSCTPAERQFLADVFTAIDKDSASTALIEKALEIALKCGMPKRAINLQKVLQKRRDVAEALKAIPQLIRSPDRPAKPIPLGPGGRPLWKVRPDRGARHLGEPLAEAGFPVVLIIFEGLQRVIKKPGLTIDGLLGQETLSKFMEKMLLNGFKKFPQTVGALAANAAKYTEVLKKGYTPAQVGRHGKGESSIPIPGVDPEDWMEFVSEMRGVGSPKSLGIWRIDPRRLKGLGVRSFPDDPRSQYRVFAMDMRCRAKEILKSGLRKALGKEIAADGEVTGEVTLSGLLALTKQAGLKGAASWLMNPDEWERYPNTTEAFFQANGIF